MNLAVIVLVAGSGQRMGAKGNKQLLEIEGKTITEIALRQFLCRPQVKQLILVSSAVDFEIMQDLASKVSREHLRVQVVLGGKTRTESVGRGVEALDSQIEYVAVHDGARPFLMTPVFEGLLEALRDHSAVIPVLPVKDTIKQVDHQHVACTLPREKMVRIQTPQCFRRDLLLSMYKYVNRMGFAVTDDASIAEEMGIPVYCVEGSEWTIKLTTPEDMVFAKAIYSHLIEEGSLCE